MRYQSPNDDEGPQVAVHETCQHCRFWDPSHAECHVNPPHQTLQARFPAAHKLDWCGRFTPMTVLER